jgi:hypothetical protein
MVVMPKSVMSWGRRSAAIVAAVLLFAGGAQVPAQAQISGINVFAGEVGSSPEQIQNEASAGIPIGTDFGTVDTGSSLTLKFYWQTNSNGSLTVNDFNLADDTNWSIVHLGFDDYLNTVGSPGPGTPSTSTEVDFDSVFEITFTPQTPGTHTTTVTIDSNASDYPAFTFDVTGIATGDSLIVEDDTAEETQSMIGQFVLNRGNNILQNQPDLFKHLDPSGNQPFSSLSAHANSKAGEVDYSVSLRQLQRAGGGDADNRGSTSDAAGQYFDVWAEVHGAWSEADTSEQSFFTGQMGAHAVISEDFLIGGMAQLDYAKETDDTLGSTIDGTGWLVGPYVVGRFVEEQLFIDVRSLWGGSSNSISPDGSYTDDFKTHRRWLLASKITGNITKDAWTLAPDVAVSYYQETQKSYTDSRSVEIGAQEFRFGEAKFGGAIKHDVLLGGGTVLQPSVAVHGISTFGYNSTTKAAGWILSEDDFRARFDLGLKAALPSALMLEVGGYYDGVGVDDYQSMGGNVGITKQF